MSNQDFLTFDIKINKSTADFLRTPMERREIETLIFDIDKVLFGAGGTLPTAIKNQNQEGENWKPLSESYLEWKKAKLASGSDISGEKVPPKKVISTDIWIRTGKALEMTQTEGNGRLKRCVIKATEFLKGGQIYAVFQKAINYLEYPNAKRPLFVWTDTAKKGVQKALNKFTNGVVKRFKGTGKPTKSLLDIGMK